jgi:hypothetical protein
MTIGIVIAIGSLIVSGLTYWEHRKRMIKWETNCLSTLQGEVKSLQKDTVEIKENLKDFKNTYWNRFDEKMGEINTKVDKNKDEVTRIDEWIRLAEKRMNGKR